MIITSSQNPKIKEIVAFYKKPALLREKNYVLIEGIKEISIAVKSDIEFISVFYCSQIIDENSLIKVIGPNNLEISRYDVDIEVFKKIAYRESVGGILILAKRPETKKLEDFQLKKDSLFVVLDAIEKPGNLGAIARVADASNISGIILTNLRTDIYNPNAVRSSLGTVFSNKVLVADFEEVLLWMKKNEITSFVAELSNSNYYYEEDLTGRIALVFGTEATGLPKDWIDNADKRIKIPMLGKIDSLNVNTSVAIIVFEAIRQRFCLKIK